MDYHSVIDCFKSISLTLLVINPGASVILAFLLVLLFSISFLVAGSEVAFFSLTFKDINMLKTKQQPAYRRIVTLLEQPKTLLAAMLITNSFVNIGIILISNILIDGAIAGMHFSFWVVFLNLIIVVTFWQLALY